ncbi:MAG: OmpH family outer membrane protein [Caulobacteraceae bacterium]|nr:OmpH family outer membrane protein [Caulobacteraceae bacterium]
MNIKTFAVRGATALALFALAPGVEAQTRSSTHSAHPAASPAPSAAPAPAGPSVTLGPPLTGVCVVSQAGVLASSAVGKSFNDRMNQLKQQVATELQPQETELATEQRTLQQASTQDPTRVAAFNLKASQYSRLRDERVQELDATSQKQLQRLYLELRPILAQLIQQKQCSILLEAEQNVLAVNPAMDLTSAAVVGLNARIQSITFDREALPQQPAPGAAQ